MQPDPWVSSNAPSLSSSGEPGHPLHITCTYLLIHNSRLRGRLTSILSFLFTVMPRWTTIHMERAVNLTRSDLYTLEETYRCKISLIYLYLASEKWLPAICNHMHQFRVIVLFHVNGIYFLMLEDIQTYMSIFMWITVSMFSHNTVWESFTCCHTYNNAV